MGILGLLSAFGWLAELVINRRVATVERQNAAALADAQECRKRLQNIEDFLLLHPERTGQQAMPATASWEPNREPLLSAPQTLLLPGTLQDQLQAASRAVPARSK